MPRKKVRLFAGEIELEDVQVDDLMVDTVRTNLANIVEMVRSVAKPLPMNLVLPFVIEAVDEYELATKVGELEHELNATYDLYVKIPRPKELK